MRARQAPARAAANISRGRVRRAVAKLAALKLNAAALLGLLLVVLFITPQRAARAELPGTIDGELARLQQRLTQAKSYDAYTLLRLTWQRWEEANPDHVENALAAARQSAALSPAARVYAGVLEAYARRRRGDLAGAKRRLLELGYVRDWLIVGPFANDNRSGLAARHVIEQELEQPVMLDRSYSGRARAVRWWQIPDVHPYGYLDFGAHLRPNRDVCAFATTYVETTEKKISLWAGATGAFRLYFNDELVLEDKTYRSLDADRRAVVVTPHAGFNRITAKVCGDEASPALSLRVGAADGAALALGKAVKTSTALAAGTSASSAMKQAGKKKASSQAGGGPLQALEAALAAAGGSPSAQLLESYASYLLVTGGDSDTSHEARDFARRAANLAPTVDRLILAAKLAEDRNGARRFVARAAKVENPSEHERIAVMLAEALVVRSGANPRDAFRLYEDVLALEPTNTEAILGKVDLYVDAGLNRTALKTLEKANQARPKSVALLRALSSQLRELRLDRRAREIESRYAALRFDDGGFLRMQLDLAAARGDASGVARWQRRLIAVEPGSVWAHREIATALLKLGKPASAIAAYEQALVIAPEDIVTMRALSDLYGRLGKRDLQLATLKKILRIRPQEKSVRTYVEHIDPQGERADEKYAWEPEKFLAMRTVKSTANKSGHALRTLHKLSVTTVFASGLASSFNQVVFQPLSKGSAASSQHYAFVYHADRQIVTLRAARVFRADGRVDEAIQSGEMPLNDPSINMYTLQRQFVVQFPKLNPGDVVELRYRIDDVSVRNEKSDYFGEVSYLQGTEPIDSVDYVLIAPKDKSLRMSIGPSDSAAAKKLNKKVTESGKQRITRVRGTKIPALKVEPRMPQLGELLAHVHVSTFASWEDVGAWYWTLARDKVDVDDDVRKVARKLAKGLETDREKVASVYRYVANETRYVALEFGIEGIRPRRAALTLARGWGDCKDKATLIVSMLSELGIGAELVILRTGLRGGFDTSTASLEPFDHAIVYIPSLDLYLDGTAEATGTGELPALDRSAIGLRISQGKGKLVELPEPPANTSREERVFAVRLKGNGDVSFKGHIRNVGVDAPSWRSRYRAPETQRERVSADLATSLGPVELRPGAAGLKVEGVQGIESPVRVDVSGTASVSKQGDTLVVPVGPAWTLVGQLAARPKRTHDLVVGPRREHSETWTVTIPPGMAASSLPKQTTIKTKFGSYVQTVKTEGTKVTVTATLRLTQRRVPVSEYKDFRAFCQAVDAASGARLLVAKK